MWRCATELSLTIRCRKSLASIYSVRTHSHIFQGRLTPLIAWSRCIVCFQKCCIKCLRCRRFPLRHSVGRFSVISPLAPDQYFLPPFPINSPFDTGDRCFIDGENLVVKKMGLFATTFIRADGTQVYYFNSQLFVKFISNIRRSDVRWVSLAKILLLTTFPRKCSRT